MRKSLAFAAGVCCALWMIFSTEDRALAGFIQENDPSAITSQDLLNGFKNPGWLMYSGDYSGQRHSPLKQITPDNVKRLAAQWTFQTETMARGRGFEATALALDGVLYVTGPNNYAWALDARTGKPFWRYRRDLPPKWQDLHQQAQGWRGGQTCRDRDD